MSSSWVYLLEAFSDAERRTLKIIAEHGSRCFGYGELMKTWKRSRTRIKWSTLERLVRELAEKGWLAREKRGRYCVTPQLELLLQEVGWIKKQAGNGA